MGQPADETMKPTDYEPKAWALRLIVALLVWEPGSTNNGVQQHLAVSWYEKDNYSSERRQQLTCHVIWYYFLCGNTWLRNEYIRNKEQYSIETKHWWTSTEFWHSLLLGALNLRRFCLQHQKGINDGQVSIAHGSSAQLEFKSRTIIHHSLTWHNDETWWNNFSWSVYWSSQALHTLKFFWWFQSTNPFWQFKTIRLWVFDWNQHLTTQYDKVSMGVFGRCHLMLLQHSLPSVSAPSSPACRSHQLGGQRVTEGTITMLLASMTNAFSSQAW